MFVEGDEASLDKKLYVIFFPKTTIVGVGNCRAVEVAVKGLRASTELHHMKAAGLIDRDNRGDISKLADTGIFPLGLYAIESISYHSAVIRAVLNVAESDAAPAEITRAACCSVSDERLADFARDTAYKASHHLVSGRLPTIDEFEKIGGVVTIYVEGDIEPTAAILSRLREAKERDDWDSLARCVKIKSTPTPGKIAQALGYRNADAYEKVARREIAKDETLIASLRALVPDPFQPPMS